MKKNVNFSEKTLGESIKHLREEQGMSQGALAKISEVSVAEICRIEKGERQNPSITLLNKLLKALDVDIDIYVQITGFAKNM